MSTVAAAEPLVMPERGLWRARYVVFKVLPSTNQWVLDHAEKCRHGDVVRTDCQTAGRGRFQRTWLSGSNVALTLSVALYPEQLGRLPPAALGQAAALAVRDTLDADGLEALLKWPNDVLVADRKIAGILVEGDPLSGPLALGIGVNVNWTTEDLQKAGLTDRATSMHVETGRTFDVQAICEALLTTCASTLDAAADEGVAFVRRAWQSHDALHDRQLIVTGPDGNVTGRYAGMAPDGRLRLIRGDGTQILFWSGDVSLST